MPVINPFVELIITVLQLYGYVLWAWLILSWLIQLNMVNRHQPVVQRINFALFRLTDPLLRPIRRVLPDLGGIDISPIILLLLLRFFEQLLLYYFWR